MEERRREDKTVRISCGNIAESGGDDYWLIVGQYQRSFSSHSGNRMQRQKQKRKFATLNDERNGDVRRELIKSWAKDKQMKNKWERI